MARIRTIKPEFFTSEDVVALTPMARLLYIALWCESDREGRLLWKPMTFKLRYFPADGCDMQALCAEIISRGMVVLYGHGMAYIPSFGKHQHVNPRESASNLPVPDARPTRAARVSDAQVGREGKGREGKGKEPATGFAAFWEAWPKSERKQDKGKCAEKFASHGLDSVLPLILADIETKKKTEKWKKGFIEAPEVYINNKRWEDGVTPGTADLTPVNDEVERTARYLAEQAEHARTAVPPPDLAALKTKLAVLRSA